MAITLGLILQNAMADQVDTTIGTDEFILYSGTPPANAKTALSGNTVLSTHVLTGFGAASSGTITANAITTVNGSATGTATFCRVVKAGTAQVQGSVGLSGSGADCIVTNTTVTSGQPVAVTSFTFTMPDA